MAMLRQGSHSRRVLTVATSVLLTVVLGVAYVTGDVIDVLPGPLTMAPVDGGVHPNPLQVRDGGTIVASSGQSVAIDASAANRVIEQFAQAEGVGSDFSIAIADATGRSVAGRDADTPREPASTLKTLTALAAASTLDMGSTLSTQSYLNQPSDGPVTVVLKGNGDMLLGERDNDSDHINGRAGLGTLAKTTAAALRQRGITSVKLVYDDTIFGEKRSPDGIDANNGDHRYFTGIASMAVDGGRQWQGAKPADPDVFSDYPQLSSAPAADAAKIFAQRLRDQGIEISGSPSEGTVPAGISPLASVESATLGEVMALMLRHSDNTLAEEFGRLTALRAGGQNSPEGAVAAVLSALGKIGIDTSAVHMADCSGLSPGSRVTANTLAEVQSHNLRSGGAVAAAEGLSVAGLVGTAGDRLADAKAAGLLRVKTGSLDAVTAMTGNVSRTGSGTLAFAVIVNGPSDYQAAKQAVDVFASRLAGL